MKPRRIPYKSTPQKVFVHGNPSDEWTESGDTLTRGDLNREEAALLDSYGTYRGLEKQLKVEASDIKIKKPKASIYDLSLNLPSLQAAGNDKNQLLYREQVSRIPTRQKYNANPYFQHRQGESFLKIEPAWRRKEEAQ